MKNNISPKLISLTFSILVICFAIGFHLYAAWTEPSQPPPSGNVPAPLNVSNVGQTKMGGLALNTGADGIISSDGATNGLLIYEGKVGIGTTSPNSQLHVQSPAGSNAEIDIQSGSSNYWAIYQSDTTDNLIFWNNPYNILSMKNMGIGYGTVGINTSNPSPSVALEVVKKGSIAVPAVLELSSDSANGTTIYLKNTGTNGHTYEIGTFSDGEFALLDWDSESETSSRHLSISPDGKVGIGTYSTVSNGLFQVNGVSTPYNGEWGQINISVPNNPGSIISSRRLRLGYDVTNEIGWIQANMGVGNKSLVLNPNGGNIGIGTISPSQKLDVVGGQIHATGDICTDQGGGVCLSAAAGGAGGGSVRYRVKYTEASNYYSLSDFGSPTSTWSLPSYGTVIFEDSTNPGSYLLEMKVNVTQAVTKPLYLLRNDNLVRFFLDGSLISGPWDVGDHRTNINYNLTPGDHTIQIIYNAQGAYDYIFLFGDIVDNTNVYYKEF